MVVLRLGVIALIRQPDGVRSPTKHQAVLQGAIRKPRRWDTRHSVQPIRDVPCARLRVSVAAVERMVPPHQERLDNRSSSCRQDQPQ